ncbi:polysaccharide biosynthesis protein, partial [Thioclava sp. BHET1]
MSLVRRSILASVAEKYASQLLAIVTLAFMSRILTPAETGLYLLANTVIMLSENLRVFGVGIFVVQEPVLERRTLRSVFTVTLIMSLTVAAAIVAAAGAFAAFFHEPELVHLLRVAAIAFLVAPFGNPIIALMQRELAFSTLAVLNVAGALANAFVTVSLALLGFGAVSYVWGFVTASCVVALLAVILRPDLRMFIPTLAGAKRIFAFGAISSSVTLLNMAYDMLPRLVLARLLGMDAVGIYGRAVTLCQLPERALVSAVQPVVLPAMAAHARNGGDLKTSYLRGHALMSAFQWPMLIMLALLADPIVRLLLGPQWGETPPLVRLIALATMATAPGFMTFPLLVSLGRIRDTLYSTLIALPPSALLIIFAAGYGLDAVAASLLFIAQMQMLIALLFIRRAIGLSG